MTVTLWSVSHFSSNISIEVQIASSAFQQALIMNHYALTVPNSFERYTDLTIVNGS